MEDGLILTYDCSGEDEALLSIFRKKGEEYELVRILRGELAMDTYHLLTEGSVVFDPMNEEE